MKKIHLVFACACALALSGCFTWHETAPVQVQMSQAPKDRETKLALSGFAATITEYVPVYGYQSYYVDGNGSITRKLNLLANYGPWWLTFRDITCYDATEIMINFANRLGYVAKPFDTGLKDHRVAWVYFDSSKVNVPGFDESCMEAYDACPVGTNNNYNAETFTYLY